jgi:autotransporter strand-loop-strand O-heptosyltransferase
MALKPATARPVANDAKTAEAPPLDAAIPPAKEEDKGPYPKPATLPTQTGPQGIRFDFNLGARVSIPAGKPWRVRLRDLDTGNILFESQPGAAFIMSTKRYFIRFGIEVLHGEKAFFQHEYDARPEHILVQFPVGTLGDIMGWFPYAVRFQQQHGCNLTCAMSPLLIPLFKDAYPHISFVTHQEVRPEQFYATYSIGLFFDDEDHVFQPCDFRLVGLHRTAGYILGVDPTEFAPELGLSDEGPPIAEPYICIAVQSTTQSKYWNNPNGWHEVVRFLKAKGYRVICIDQKPVHGGGITWNHIPHGVEDQTGDRPLAERVRWLRHAKAFIGLSSGLSWLAWAAGVPVVMISGFTHPTNEFSTPYRVINYHACNSCWNDVRHRFDHKDFLWCPRHAGTPRQFECTRLIAASQVIATLAQIV